MRLKYVVLFLFLLCNSNTLAQTYSRIIPDKEIVGFIKQLDLNKLVPGLRNIDPDIRTWGNEQFTGSTFDGSKGILDQDSCKKYLSAADIDFMAKQAQSQLSKSWQASDLNGYTLITAARIREINEIPGKGKDRIKHGQYYIFSLPLFSIDKHFVVINHFWVCGFMCANRCTYLFQLEKNKYTKITEWHCSSE